MHLDRPGLQLNEIGPCVMAVGGGSRGICACVRKDRLVGENSKALVGGQNWKKGFVRSADHEGLTIPSFLSHRDYFVASAG